MGSLIRVGSIVPRVADLARQTEFWTAAPDYVPREEDSDGFVLLRPRNGGGPNLSLDGFRSRLQVPPRIHLDLDGHGGSPPGRVVSGGRWRDNASDEPSQVG